MARLKFGSHAWLLAAGGSLHAVAGPEHCTGGGDIPDGCQAPGHELSWLSVSFIFWGKKAALGIPSQVAS